MLLTFLNILATIIGVISLLIVTYGVFVGFIAFLRNEFKRINGTYTINNVRQLRADFGSYLLLGLEFLIASDILKTVVDPTLDELAILGGVVMVHRRAVFCGDMVNGQEPGVVAGVLILPAGVAQPGDEKFYRAGGSLLFEKHEGVLPVNLS